MKDRAAIFALTAMMLWACNAPRSAGKCAVCPPRPHLLALDAEEHFGSRENVERLLFNLITLKSYSDRLEMALGCHEISDGGSDES